MGLAIAILLTLAMLGSVLWVMPSPREKQSTAMRQRAMSARIKVRLLDQSTANKLFPWLENYRGYVSYELPLPIGQKWSLTKPVVMRLDQSKLHELDRKNGVEGILEQLQSTVRFPDSAEALVFYSSCVGLLWRETEGMDGCEAAIACLTQCLKLSSEQLQALT